MTLYFDLVKAMLCLAQLFVSSDQDARGVVFLEMGGGVDLRELFIRCRHFVGNFIFHVLDVSNLYAKR
jgi:hypothetical protein